jgi:hypothetical protein
MRVKPIARVLSAFSQCSLFSVLLAVAPASNAALIQLNFVGAVNAVQQQTFSDAASFWNSTITGYQLGYLRDGSTRPHQLTIDVTIPNIDGIGGILGSAGPTYGYFYRDALPGFATRELLYASEGEMQFDLADVDMMVEDNLFYGVVLHELAHVIGIGTLWELNGLYTVGSGEYYGAAALAAWQSEFNRPNATSVPVELAGGPGTANGHWDEVNGGAGNTGIVSSLTGLDLSRELMTGWASSSFFIAKMTLGSLVDLGYSVDYSKAGLVNYTSAVPEPAGVLVIAGWMTAVLLTRRRGVAGG